MKILAKRAVTVTIGIPAYNEEENIVFLLRSILKQKQKAYKIEKVIVICDGCTDNTASEVREWAKKYSLINLIEEKKRLGKSQRLNQLYKINQSDILVTIDADIILPEDDVISELLRFFKNKKIIFVAPNNQPVAASNLIEKITNAAYQLWYEIRKDYKNGNNVHNFQGMMFAIRKSFASSVKYPKGIITDSGFLYLKAKQEDLISCFVEKVIIFFQSPNNLRDFFLQANRSFGLKQEMFNYFGEKAYLEYNIPAKYKIRGIIKSFIKNPIFISLALAVNLWARIFPPLQDPLLKDGQWTIAKSTKKAIKTGNN